MTRSSDQLVFVPLGGLGEIGMNAALYGFGPEGRRKWILVDCGLSFAGPRSKPAPSILSSDIVVVGNVRSTGDILGGPKPFDRNDRSRYLQALDEIIQKERRRRALQRG